MMEEKSVDHLLEEAYGAAVEIMKTRAVSFYQAFRLLPEDRFKGVAAVYALCRAADDIADREEALHQPGQTRQSLDDLESALVRYYQNGMRPLDVPPVLTWWKALEDTIRRFNVPMGSFLQQIEGQRRDLAFEEMRTLEDLIEYSRLVAGSVGTMLLPLLAEDHADIQDPDWQLACEHLGIGMQITNILRDVGEDLRLRNRIYLPTDLRLAFGVSRDELAALAGTADGQAPRVIPDSIVALWEHLAAIADPYYAAYEAWLCRFHPSCRLSLVAAARIYRAIADAVREAGYDCFSRRCYTSDAMRDTILREAAVFVESYPC